MPAVSTPAIVLSALRYGESSKIVRLATQDLGVQSAIARGALRPRSRFGSGLQLLSGGVASLVMRDGRDLSTLAAFDVATVPLGLTGDVARFAAASVMAELMVRCGQPTPQPDGYAVLRDALAILEITPGAALDVLALRSLWQLIVALGYAPALEACARDGVPVPADRPAPFSPADGGVLCATCAAGWGGTRLPPEARADLAALVDPARPLPLLDDRNASAHRRLLARYVEQHLADGSAFPALTFWLARSWVP